MRGFVNSLPPRTGPGFEFDVWKELRHIRNRSFVRVVYANFGTVKDRKRLKGIDRDRNDWGFVKVLNIVQTGSAP